MENGDSRFAHNSIVVVGENRENNACICAREREKSRFEFGKSLNYGFIHHLAIDLLGNGCV